MRGVIALLVLFMPRVLAAQAADAGLSATARRYLDTAIDSVQAVSMRREMIDWSMVRRETYARATNARRPADTWAAIQWMLSTVDKHSFLQRPMAASRGVGIRALSGGVGYVRIPSRGGEAVALADSLQDGLRQLDGRGTCAWIVDLRGNPGGNVWPMYAGIGPLLGDSIIGDGSARYAAGVASIVERGSAPQPVTRITVPPVTLRDPLAPVAVLIDEFTGSSAEAVALAFKGRPATRFFGVRTAGYTTGNRGITLADGANLVVTVNAMADRTGRQYPDGIEPDEEVEAIPQDGDAVETRAAAWLVGRASCRPSHGTLAHPASSGPRHASRLHPLPRRAP